MRPGLVLRDGAASTEIGLAVMQGKNGAKSTRLMAWLRVQATAIGYPKETFGSSETQISEPDTGDGEVGYDSGMRSIENGSVWDQKGPLAPWYEAGNAVQCVEVHLSVWALQKRVEVARQQSADRDKFNFLFLFLELQVEEIDGKGRADRHSVSRADQSALTCHPCLRISSGGTD